MAIYGKTGYIEKERKRPNHKDKTFSAKWGERAESIAQREDVAVATIHMRVNRLKTPYMRRAKPTESEQLCGKTLYQLAEELNLTPISVQQRIRLYGNPYISQRNIKQNENNSNYRLGRYKLWLMEDHPCFAEWKASRDKQDAELLAEAIKQEQQREQQRLERLEQRAQQKAQRQAGLGE